MAQTFQRALDRFIQLARLVLLGHCHQSFLRALTLQVETSNHFVEMWVGWQLFVVARQQDVDVPRRPGSLANSSQ